MSLITRCPACNTLFKVVADQLKISQGWVRCGQCAEVFDAQMHMASEVSQSTPPPVDTEHGSQVPAVVAATPPANDVIPAAPAYAAVNEADAPALDTSSALDADASQDGAVESSDVSSKATATYAGFSDSDWFNKITPPAPHSLADAANSDFSKTPSPSPSVPPSLAEPTPSFVRQAQRAQRWQSPWVGGVLLLMGAVLLAALGAQVALHERDRIAAQDPRFGPWLKQLCAMWGCSVGPLKQIEAVVVDASSFSKLRSDGKFELYKFGLNLKNTGILPVAVPHIELSLNDAQDQPVVRRVLKPADLGSAQSDLAPSGELVGTTTVQVDSTQLAGARIAGYRVWAFYP